MADAVGPHKNSGNRSCYSLYLATDAALKGRTGEIYKDMTVRNIPERIRSHPQADNVWRFLLDLHFNGN